MEYHSYLLMFWRPDTHSDWRYVVELVATGERFTFSRITDVFAFLQQMKVAPLFSNSLVRANESPLV